MAEKIYHITSKSEWQKTEDVYRSERLETDGFIHCSYPEQLVDVANSNFRGRDDLVILAIERSKTGCEVVDENLFGGDMLFPHVYGAIPVKAVFDVIPFPCDDEGFFHLPEGIEDIAI